MEHKPEGGSPLRVVKPEQPIPSLKEMTDLDRQINHATLVEGTKRAFEGIHDYRSNVRLLGFELSRGGSAGLFAYIQAHPIETFSEYFKRVSESNQNLVIKIQNDLALYPGIATELNEIITRVNGSIDEKSAFDAYKDLLEFFEK